MKNFLDMLPSNCKDEVEGISRAAMIDDMISEGTVFSEMEICKDGAIECSAKRDTKEVLEAIYRGEHSIVMWNSSLKEHAALFGFDDINQKAIMLFPMSINGFKQSFLKSTIDILGGRNMAKICPLNDQYVLYLDCKECENKHECEAK